MKSLPLLWTAMVSSMAVPSCSRDPEKIRLVNEEADAMRAEHRALASQLSETRRQLQAAAADKEGWALARLTAEALIGKTREDVSALKAEFAAYRHDYRRAIQARAKGITLPGFTAGTIRYDGVVVSSATDAELTLLTSEGIAKVPLRDTPRAVQELFAYDPSLPPAAPAVKFTAPVNLVENAIQDGKRAAEENKRILLERKAASQKKRRPPAYLQAPSATGKSWSWRNHSSFEGSYYAPLKKH